MVSVKRDGCGGTGAVGRTSVLGCESNTAADAGKQKGKQKWRGGRVKGHMAGERGDEARGTGFAQVYSKRKRERKGTRLHGSIASSGPRCRQVRASRV